MATSPHWDTLDWLASRVIGPLVLRHRQMEARLAAWPGSPNLWQRRAALLAHLKQRERTTPAC